VDGSIVNISLHPGPRTLTSLDINQVLLRQGLSSDRIRSIVLCTSALSLGGKNTVPIYRSINDFS
jgi:hypothetical protein